MIQEDRVDVIVSGSYSAQTRAVAPVAAQANKLMVVGYAVDPEITQAGDSIWRVGELATIQGQVGGELVTGTLGAKRVAILQVDNDFGASLVASFRPYVESKGAEVVYATRYPLDEKDYRPILSSAAAAEPDVIYAPGYYANGADILKQANELGVTAQIVGVEGYDSPSLIELAGKSANGVIITTELNRDSESKVVQEFIAAYEEASGGRAADAVAAEVYDATVVAMRALDQADSADTDRLIEALQNMDDFSYSVTGIIKFDDNRNAIRPGIAQIVEDGEFHHYATFDDPAVIEAD
jgi:branched-chain amino acid transport system substrate-binding protein